MTTVIGSSDVTFTPMKSYFPRNPWISTKISWNASNLRRASEYGRIDITASLMQDKELNHVRIFKMSRNKSLVIL